jgi:hypothetical protein
MSPPLYLELGLLVWVVVGVVEEQQRRQRRVAAAVVRAKKVRRYHCQLRRVARCRSPLEQLAQVV